MIFTENNLYQLRPLNPQDRDYYMRTVIANSNTPGMYKMPGFSDYMWETTPQEDEQIFCIFEKPSGSYCGFCNVRKSDTTTPEIGISLLPEYQGKEIGVQALHLLMDTFRIEHPVDYFIARVESSNRHSLRLMEKMDAVLFQFEDSEFKQAMDALSARMAEKGIFAQEERQSPMNSKYICTKIASAS